MERKTANEAARAANGGTVIVIHPELRARAASHGDRSAAARLDEASSLAGAIGLQVAEALIVRVGEPRPATFLGEGKVAEIGGLCHAVEPTVIYVDGPLTPVQQRNLEKAWEAKVIDRTGLILEIFGARARTREGRLQVELAHLTYQRSRLVRSWTHLERQRGGFGFLGGPGETQIETDRRLIGDRIAKIRKELEASVRTRGLHRAARKKVPYPVVALAGYTNAGKSTLFNALTAAEVMAKDMLFATLDPTMRAVKLPGGRRVILSDTVGFISDLPTQLVAAFRATLEEVLEADLILHVRDMSHPDAAAQRADVEAVLEELGLDQERLDRMAEVWNKIDLMPADERRKLRLAAGRGHAFPVSALTGDGLDALRKGIEAALSVAETQISIAVDPADGAGLAWVYENASVRGRKTRADGSLVLSVSVATERADAMKARFPAPAKMAKRKAG
jgi:GTPase